MISSQSAVADGGGENSSRAAVYHAGVNHGSVPEAINALFTEHNMSSALRFLSFRLQ
jgi:hypothetical protein